MYWNYFMLNSMLHILHDLNDLKYTSQAVSLFQPDTAVTAEFCDCILNSSCDKGA